jgi:hypothetical protein
VPSLESWSTIDYRSLPGISRVTPGFWASKGPGTIPFVLFWCDTERLLSGSRAIIEISMSRLRLGSLVSIGKL